MHSVLLSLEESEFMSFCYTLPSPLRQRISTSYVRNLTYKLWCTASFITDIWCRLNGIYPWLYQNHQAVITKTDCTNKLHNHFLLNIPKHFLLIDIPLIFSASCTTHTQYTFRKQTGFPTTRIRHPSTHIVLLVKLCPTPQMQGLHYLETSSRARP